MLPPLSFRNGQGALSTQTGVGAPTAGPSAAAPQRNFGNHSSACSWGKLQGTRCPTLWRQRTSDMVPITSNTCFKKINFLCHLLHVILFRTEIHHVADFLATVFSFPSTVQLISYIYFQKVNSSKSKEITIMNQIR